MFAGSTCPKRCCLTLRLLGDSKAVPLLQFFFVCASMVSYVTFVLSLFCSSSLRRLMPQEGCGS